MNDSEFKDLLADAAASRDTKIFLSTHAKQRMRERDVTLSQVKQVLKTGRFTEGPFQEANGSWKMNVTGRACGQIITVVVVMDIPEKGKPIFLVTVMTNSS